MGPLRLYVIVCCLFCFGRHRFLFKIRNLLRWALCRVADCFVSLVEPQCFTFPAVKTCVLSTALRPPFSIFSEERIRHGLVSGEIFAFALPLLTPFTIFVSRRWDSVRHSQFENEIFTCLCSHLSLSLFHEDRMRFGIVNLKTRFSFASALTFLYLCRYSKKKI